MTKVIKKVNATGVLSLDSIRRGIKMLNEDARLTESLIWIDNHHFYKGEIARAVGFGCTDKELKNAAPDGFIKTAKGVRLYLSRLAVLSSPKREGRKKLLNNCREDL